MIMTYEQYMNRIAERTYDNTRAIKKSIAQRRNGMEDLYGVCFSSQGDSENPASFYISLSPDYTYLQRFAFKFVIKPYVTTVKGSTSDANVNVGFTALTITTASDRDRIAPDPHNHTTNPHSHNIISGVGYTHTTSSDWEVHVGGVDITPYLIEQQDGAWISGEGVFPNNRLESTEDFYDILAVASVLDAEGNVAARDKILSPEFKKVEVFSDAPFGIDAYLYLKYPNTNR